jgi:hypothetical protein
MTAPLYDVIIESPVRWADNRRIFACAGVSGSMLARLELEANAIDEQVMDAIEYLRTAMLHAEEAHSKRAALSLVKDS